MKTLLALAVLPLTALAAAFTPTARAQTAYQRTWTATANADWRAPSDADGAASWVAWGTGVAQTTTGDRFVLAGATGYSINIPAETTIALVGDLAFADNTNYDVMRYLRSTAEDGKAGLNVTTNTAGAKWVVTGGGTLHTGDAHPRGYAILLTAGQPQTLSIKTKITGAGGIAVANGGANGTKTADDTSQWVLDLAGDISEWTGRLTNCANRNIRLSGNVTALNAAATVWLGKFWNGDNNGSERQYGGYYTLLIDALDADFTFAAPVSAATTNGNSNSDGGIYINAGAHTVTLAHTQNNAATTIAGGTVAAASDANLTTNPTFRLGNARLLFSAAVPTSYARAITLTAPATLASAATDGDFHTYAGALTGNHALAFEGNLALNTSLPAGYTAAVSVAAGGTLRPLRADALSLAAPLNVAAGGALALAGDVAHALPETGIAAGGALVAGAMASGGSSGNTLRASSETVTFGVAAGKVVTLAAGAKIRVNAGAAGTTTTFAVAGGNGAGLALPAASGGNGGTTGTTGGAALTVEFPEAFAAATPDAPAGDVVLRGFSAAQRSALLAAPLVNAPAGAVFIEVGAGDAALLAAGLQAGDLVLAAFPLNITTPPPELVAATIGDAVALNAVATGEGLSCRWQFSADGSEGSFADITGGSVGVGGAGGGVTGSASASLAIAAATPAHAGFYRLVVSDRFGRSATTGVVTLTVAVPSFSIAANGQPQSVAALAPHGSAAFSVVANITGGGTAGDGSALRFQWQWFDEGAGAWRDVADDAAAGVSGASTATLTFADALPAQAGRYRVVVTNAHSAAWPQYAPAQTSAEATLAFALPAVVFAAQPAGASARLLGTVAFAALATGDTSGGNALVYRWQKRANSAAAWTDLADVAGGKVTGSATPELVIAALAPADAGEVRCSATDQWGTRAFSAAATLSLTLPALVSQSGDTVARARSSAAFSAAFADTVEGVTYQWFRVVDEGTTGGAGNGAGGAGVVNIGGVLALALADGAKVTGSATSALTLRDVFPDDAGGYFCGAFFDGALVAASAPATLTVALDPLVITAQPADAACYERYAARFEVAAAGHDAALAYQWLKDGEPLANATARVLTIASARFADAGAYSVVVSDAYGRAVESRAALLDVLAAPPAFGVAGNLPDTATADARGSLTLRVVPESGLGYQLQWQTRAPADATGTGDDDGGGADGTGGDDGWVDLPGQTETALRLVSLTAADNGRQFRVVATNATGTVISFTTTLTGIPGDEDEEDENDTGDGTTGGSSSGTTGGTGSGTGSSTGDSADDSTEDPADGSAADGSGSPSTGTGTTGGDNSTGTDTDTGTPPTDSTGTAAPSPLTVLFAALRGTDPTAAPAPIRILIQPADTSLSAARTTLATGATTTGTATLRVLATGGGQIYYLWHRWIPASATGTTGTASAGTWEPIPAAVGPTLRVTTPGTYRCLLNNALRLPVTTAPATVLP